MGNCRGRNFTAAMAHKRNIVKTPTTTLSCSSKVDNELQPYFHQNERSSGLDINIGLYGKPSVRRGRTKCNTEKRCYKKYSITSLLFSVVSSKSFHTSIVSCWLFYNCLFGKNVLCHNLGSFLLGEMFNNFTNIQCSITKIT